jgi:hypothetical protein
MLAVVHQTRDMCSKLVFSLGCHLHLNTRPGMRVTTKRLQPPMQPSYTLNIPARRGWQLALQAACVTLVTLSTRGRIRGGCWIGRVAL